MSTPSGEEFTRATRVFSFGCQWRRRPMPSWRRSAPPRKPVSPSQNGLSDLVLLEPTEMKQAPHRSQGNDKGEKEGDVAEPRPEDREQSI